MPNAAVAVATTATIVLPSTWTSGLIQNLGPNDIYVGQADVTVTTGLKVAASGGVASLDVFRGFGVLYAICSVLQATPLDTRVLYSNAA